MEDDFLHGTNIQDLINLLQTENSLKDFREAFENPDDSAEFAGKAEFRTYDQGVQVIKQGEPGNEFFIVMSGQLRVIDVSGKTPRLLDYFSTGEIVGERVLLGSERRTATVEVITSHAKLAFFNENDWNWLLGKNSRFGDYFQNLEGVRLQKSSVDFPGRQWDEVIVDSTKRHFIAFMSTLTLPIVLLIAPVLFFLIAELLGINVITVISDFLARITLLPFVTAALLLIVYNYFDWRNDDFIVTTKRVIHIERYLFFGEQRKDAPLTRIQDVTVTSGILDVLFEADNLRIKTAGAGEIDFSNIRRANQIRQSIFRERERAKARVAASDVAALRQNIADELNWDEKIEKGVVPVAESEAVVVRQPKTRHYNRLIDYFVPRGKEVNDIESGTVIVWRKHFFVLFLHIFLPVMAILISSYLFLSSLILWLPPFGTIAALPVQIGLGIAILAGLFWYIWQYDDWNKDLYMVTDTQIIDIESSSFRLVRTRREGTFDSIQSVYSDVPSVFYKLLNMGNVIIETAGTQDTFTFNNVFDPASVTREVFNRWASYQQQEREKDRDTTTNQVLQVLKEYHRLAHK